MIEVDAPSRSASSSRERGRFRRERGRRRRGRRHLLRGRARARCVGYIGPNGAGKSTTIKMLTGILVPTAAASGSPDSSPSRQRIELARRIGVVFGQRTQLWWDLPLLESFELLRHIYRVPADALRANLARFRELLELDPFLDTPVRQLSLGQRMRGELAAALLHDPRVLFLDEPTIGLDVVAQGARPRLPAPSQPRARRHGAAHDPRPRRHRAAVPRLLVIDHGRLI